MTKIFDQFGLRGRMKTGQDNLAQDLIKLVDTSKDRTTLLTNLVTYVQKREAIVWQDGYQKAKAKYLKVK